MKKVKKTPAILLSLCVAFSSIITAFAAENQAFFPMARVDAQNSAIVDALTPRNSDDINPDASWFFNTGANDEGWGKWSYPIVAEDYIYIAVNSTLMKLDQTGEKVKEVTMPSNALRGGYTGWLAYGEGMIFVPSGTTLMAFDADDLSMVWEGLSGIAAGSQSSCPIIYKDGYVYSGVTNGSSGGGFYCFDITDEDPDTADEDKQPVWKLEGTEGQSTGFYWAGASIIGNYLVVPCDDGYVYSIDLDASKTAEGGAPTIKDALYPDGKKTNIRNSIIYEEASGRIFFCTSTGIHAVEFDKEAGTFGEMETVAEVAASASTTVAIYNGRLYTTGNDGITVVNTETLERIYSTGKYQVDEKKSVIPSNVTISIGYATEENGNTVYVYGNSNTSPNYQLVLKDNETATEGTLALLNAATESPNWSTSQVYVAANGSLIFVNDSGYIYYLASKPGAVVYPVEEMVSVLSEELTDENEEAFLTAEAAYNALDEAHQPLVKEALVAKLQALRQAYDDKQKQEEENENNDNNQDDNKEENTPTTPTEPENTDQEEIPDSGVPTAVAGMTLLLSAGVVTLISRKKKSDNKSAEKAN